MREIKFTLLSEGTSDKALLYILSWLLREHFSTYEIQPDWADLSRFPRPPKKLSERIQSSLYYYPCDLLFIHRDSDNQGRSQRISEIDKALNEMNNLPGIPIVRVIPVRMTETWLLFNEAALRCAADNPQGKQSLSLPNLKSLESCSDPKKTLHSILEQASEASGRRLKKFKARMNERVLRVAELIDDFSPLRTLSAFQLLEDEIKRLPWI